MSNYRVGAKNFSPLRLPNPLFCSSKKSPKCNVLQKRKIDSEDEIAGIYLKGGILLHVRIKSVWHEICCSYINYYLQGCKDEAV